MDDIHDKVNKLIIIELVKQDGRSNFSDIEEEYFLDHEPSQWPLGLTKKVYKYLPDNVKESLHLVEIGEAEHTHNISPKEESSSCTSLGADKTERLITNDRSALTEIQFTAPSIDKNYEPSVFQKLAILTEMNRIGKLEIKDEDTHQVLKTHPREWATRTQNLLHAYLTPSNKRNTPPNYLNHVTSYELNSDAMRAEMHEACRLHTFLGTDTKDGHAISDQIKTLQYQFRSWLRDSINGTLNDDNIDNLKHSILYENLTLKKEHTFFSLGQNKRDKKLMNYTKFIFLAELKIHLASYDHSQLMPNYWFNEHELIYIPRSKPSLTEGQFTLLIIAFYLTLGWLLEKFYGYIYALVAMAVILPITYLIGRALLSPHSNLQNPLLFMSLAIGLNVAWGLAFVLI